MGTATDLQLNVRGVAFTPQGGGTALAINKVTSVTVDGGGSLLMFAGDGDRFPTLQVNDFSDPTINVNTSNMIAASSLSIGTHGILTFTFKDAKNPSVNLGTGDIQFNVNLAVVQNESYNQAFRTIGTATLPFKTESVDGITPPISVTISA